MSKLDEILNYLELGKTLLVETDYIFYKNGKINGCNYKVIISEHYEKIDSKINRHFKPIGEIKRYYGVFLTHKNFFSKCKQIDGMCYSGCVYIKEKL